MASKFKARERPVWTPAEQRSRINKALAEGRTQQALELVRTLFKQESTPEHLDLVRRATLERARQLRHSGKTRDAVTVLTNATDLGGIEYLKEVSRELAASGAIRQAADLAAKLDDPALGEHVLGQAADSAVRQGPAGRSLLPADLWPQCDLIQQAFARSAAGEDEQARALLQGIGLRSPFLEWKLFLRGLLAYYGNDDARALENWQRLDSTRLAFRLAAPFRMQLDSAFRQAQPPDVQNQLEKTAEDLQGVLTQQLRTVQSALAQKKTLATAFRLMENLLPSLRQQHPAVIPRLAACFYWAIIERGDPEDKNRYRRVFAAPADDCHLLRLEALALEARGHLQEAHHAWEDYQTWLDKEPAWGSPELRQRARALVWARMGENADRFESFLPHFDHEDELPLPDPIDCYRNSLHLAPDRLKTHQDLFEHYLERGQTKKALAAGRALLKRFPEHVLTLERMGDLFTDQGDRAQAVKMYQRAAQLNPLEKRLRAKLATAHLYEARELATAGNFEAARAAYQVSMNLEQSDKANVLTKWAACEFAAGQAERAEELIQQARAEGRLVPIAYALTIEAQRFQLAPSLKGRFAAEFETALNEAPDVETALALLALAADHSLAGVKYRGQKAHEKKVLAYLEAAFHLPWTEAALATACERARSFAPVKISKKLLQKIRNDFRDSPIPFIQEAKRELDRKRPSPWRVRSCLVQARQRAELLPDGERRQQLLQQITDLEKLMPPEGLFGGFSSFPNMDIFGELMEMMGDDDDDDEF